MRWDYCVFGFVNSIHHEPTTAKLLARDTAMSTTTFPRSVSLMTGMSCDLKSPVPSDIKLNFIQSLFLFPVSLPLFSVPFPFFRCLSLLTFPFLSFAFLFFPILSFPFLSFPFLSFPFLSFALLCLPSLAFLLSFPLPSVFFPFLSYPFTSRQEKYLGSHLH